MASQLPAVCSENCGGSKNTLAARTSSFEVKRPPITGTPTVGKTYLPRVHADARPANFSRLVPRPRPGGSTFAMGQIGRMSSSITWSPAQPASAARTARAFPRGRIRTSHMPAVRWGRSIGADGSTCPSRVAAVGATGAKKEGQAVLGQSGIARLAEQSTGDTVGRDSRCCPEPGSLPPPELARGPENELLPGV